MAIFKSGESYIARELAEVSEEDRPKRRLEIDLADILTGPTSAGNADHLAHHAARDPLALAEAMKAAADRYLKSVK